MRLIKGFLIALIGLFLMITILSLFIPSRVMTAKSVVIHAPLKKIGEQVFDFQNWKHWHPVFMSDSESILTSIPSVGVNANAEWISTNKKNKLVFTEVSQDLVRVSLKRPGEKDIENIISLVHLNDSSGVEVEWRALTRLKWYPWEKFAGIFVDKITGPGYEAALNNLKQYCEAH